MDDAEQTKSQTSSETPQQLVGFMTNEEWDALLAHVNGLIQEMENLPFPEVKRNVFQLLEGIDAIHREALSRLVRLFKEGVLEKVVSDPVIHTLMELYDLLPPEAGSAPEEKAPERAKTKFPNIPVKVVPAALKQSRPTLQYPHWIPVLQKRDALAPGAVKEFDIDDHQMLLCRVNDEFFAIDSHCAGDGSSLAGGTLKGYTLACPNHQGCYYDVRQGTRIARGEQIVCYPIKLEKDGRVLVGLDMEFKPNLPSF